MNLKYLIVYLVVNCAISAVAGEIFVCKTVMPAEEGHMATVTLKTEGSNYYSAYDIGTTGDERLWHNVKVSTLMEANAEFIEDLAGINKFDGDTGIDPKQVKWIKNYWSTGEGLAVIGLIQLFDQKKDPMGWIGVVLNQYTGCYPAK